jgi:hypothetical protein
VQHRMQAGQGRWVGASFQNQCISQYVPLSRTNASLSM